MTFQQGDRVRLAGTSKKGKQVIKSKGEHWLVHAVVGKVLFSDKPGPWLYVYPSGTGLSQSRWVHETEDANFAVS